MINYIFWYIKGTWRLVRAFYSLVYAMCLSYVALFLYKKIGDGNIADVDSAVVMAFGALVGLLIAGEITLSWFKYMAPLTLYFVHVMIDRDFQVLQDASIRSVPISSRENVTHYIWGVFWLLGLGNKFEKQNPNKYVKVAVTLCVLVSLIALIYKVNTTQIGKVGVEEIKEYMQEVVSKTIQDVQPVQETVEEYINENIIDLDD